MLRPPLAVVAVAALPNIWHCFFDAKRRMHARNYAPTLRTSRPIITFGVDSGLPAPAILTM